MANVGSVSSARRLVVHAGDVGMSHGANVAVLELSRLGSITSGSVMVPCPWFAEIASAAAADPALDLGVHLTLCSEQRGYKWRPVGHATAASGLIDDDGYLWPDVASVRRHAYPEAVEAEWRAQIDRALAAGIDVTHLDAHMGAALGPEFCNRYVRVGADYHLPVLITSVLSRHAPQVPHLADVSDAAFAPYAAYAAKVGMPLFDQVVVTDFTRPSDRPADYRAVLGGIEGDLAFCAFHPAAPGDIQVIEPSACHVRIDEYELFRTDEWCEWLSGQGFALIGMRTLRDEYRAAHT